MIMVKLIIIIQSMSLKSAESIHYYFRKQQYSTMKFLSMKPRAINWDCHISKAFKRRAIKASRKHKASTRRKQEVLLVNDESTPLSDVECLHDAIHPHFSTRVGGNWNAERILTLAKRVSNLLKFAKDIAPTKVKGRDPLRRFHYLVMHQKDVIPHYLASLESELKDTTLRIFSCSFSSFLHWFVLYYEYDKKVLPPIPAKKYELLKDIITSCISSYRKSALKNKPYVSVEQLKQDGMWPEGGIKEIQEGFPLLEIIAKQYLQMDCITDDDLKWYLGFLSTHFYAFAPQGRVGGIKSLTVEQGSVLLETSK